MLKINQYFIVSTLILICLVNLNSVSKASAADKIIIADFSNKNLHDWKSKSFEGDTEYSIKSEDQNYFLQAKSNQSASALYKKIKVDIHKTPFLNWSWRVDEPLSKLKEKEKSGDDYAARVYVVFKTGFTPLSARALNYVWSSNSASNTAWSNAYTDKAIMVPLRSNQDEVKVWQHEKVNVKEDMLKHFGEIPEHIEGIAIMTDTDNSKGTSSADYDDIYFSSD